MLESQIERALITEVEKHGAKARKFVSPGWAGAPDQKLKNSLQRYFRNAI